MPLCAGGPGARLAIALEAHNRNSSFPKMVRSNQSTDINNSATGPTTQREDGRMWALEVFERLIKA